MKQAKTNKQYTETEDLLTIFAISNSEHVALILENAVFLFNSHHGSVFRCFHDSLFFWWFTGNNYLTSATKHRKVKRLMPGKKCKN